MPVHVDGASGGFVAPFIDPDLEWDFRLPARAVDQRVGPQVRARVPGRRLGHLARPRRAARGPRVPRQLPGRQHADVRAQLLAPGQPGRGAVLQLPAPRLRRLPARPADVARRRPLHRRRDRQARAVPAAHRRQRAARCSRSRSTDADRPYTVFDVSERLRDRGWLVPAYTFPENRQDLAALRIVVRNGFSRDLADLLIADLRRHVDFFAKSRRRCRRRPKAVASPTDGRRVGQNVAKLRDLAAKCRRAGQCPASALDAKTDARYPCRGAGRGSACANVLSRSDPHRVDVGGVARRNRRHARPRCAGPWGWPCRSRVGRRRGRVGYDIDAAFEEHRSVTEPNQRDLRTGAA